MEEAQIVATFTLPPNEQASETVVPRVCSLDDPSPRLASGASDQGRLSAASDVRLDAALTHGLLAVGVVVAFVEADVVGTSRAAGGANHHRVER